MAQITNYDSPKQNQKQNLSILKKAWEKFLSYDAFTRVSAVALGLIVFATPMILSHTQTASNQASTPLATPPAIYSGVSAQGASNDLSSVFRFETDSGKKVSIINFYQQWGNQYNQFNFSSMDAIRNHGSIPMITWEPWAGKIADPSYSLQKIINGSYDRYITKFAQDAKAWNHPFFLRFAHEANGSWYSWGEDVNGNSSAQYVKAWQHVHNIFSQVGTANATWVWSVNTACGSSCLVNLSQFYPGDSYVDWVGIDGYTTDKNWQSFSDLLSNPYAQLTTLAPSKPIMISEIGISENNQNPNAKAAWITDAYSVELSNNFPGIKAIVWFNFDKSEQGGQNWQIESSSLSQQAFAKAISSSYFMNNAYSDIIESPIPPVGEYSPPSGESSGNSSSIAPSQ